MGCGRSKKYQTAKVHMHSAPVVVDEFIQNKHLLPVPAPGSPEDLAQILNRITKTDGEVARIMMQRATSFVVVDMPSEKLVFVSPSFTKLWGFSEEEIIGKNWNFLQADDRDQHSGKIVRKAFKSQKGAVVLWRNYKKNGELVYNLSYLKPLIDENGFNFGYLGCQQNVTEQVREIPKDLQESIANSVDNINDEILGPQLKKSSIFFGESLNVLFDAVQSAELREKQISAINSLISEE